MPSVIVTCTFGFFAASLALPATTDPCGTIGDLGCQRTASSLLGENPGNVDLKNSPYNSKWRAEIAGWVFGEDGHATQCGGTRFTNSQNSVKQVDNDVVLPIKSGEVCQKCLICSNVQLNHFIEGNYPDAQYVQQGTG